MEGAVTERPSLNGCVKPLISALISDHRWLRLAVSQDNTGARLIDAGISMLGSLEAGRRIAELCLGGLGWVRFSDLLMARWRFGVTVSSTDPVLACLASQLAGWQLKEGSFFALGSGPARALARCESLFAELGYADTAEETVLVLEVDRIPPSLLLERIASACNIAPGRLTVILTPTRSLAGTVQIVSRVLEVALHKVHELGFPLSRVVDGLASAPLPPPAPDFITAMGRTNDAIIFGGFVHLFVTGPEAEAAALARALPAPVSPDYGRPFAEVFRAANGDFYAIDRGLFSPAQVTVTALETGRSYHAGAINEALLDASFSESEASGFDGKG